MFPVVFSVSSCMHSTCSLFWFIFSPHEETLKTKRNNSFGQPSFFVYNIQLAFLKGGQTGIYPGKSERKRRVLFKLSFESQQRLREVDIQWQ